MTLSKFYANLQKSVVSWLRRTLSDAGLHMLAPLEINQIMTKTRNAGLVNSFINHPDIVDGLSLGMPAPIDVSPLVDDEKNICFIGEFGGALLHWCAPAVYDIHDFVLPEGRGKWARDAAQEIFHTMWGDGCLMLWCRTPVENRASRMFNRILGFKSLGIIWHSFGGDIPAMPVETFVMVNPCL